MPRNQKKQRARVAAALALAAAAADATPPAAGPPGPRASTRAQTNTQFSTDLKAVFGAPHLLGEGASANGSANSKPHFDGDTLATDGWFVIGLDTVRLPGGKVVRTPWGHPYRACLRFADPKRTPSDLCVPRPFPEWSLPPHAPPHTAAPSAAPTAPATALRRRRLPHAHQCTLPARTNTRPFRFWYYYPSVLQETVGRPNLKCWAWMLPTAYVTRGSIIAMFCVSMLCCCAGVAKTRGSAKPSNTNMIMSGWHASMGKLFPTYSNFTSGMSKVLGLETSLKTSEDLALEQHHKVRSFVGLPQ